MKSDLRPKKLALKAETLRLLESNQVAAAQGGSWTFTTVVYTEGACEGYSWIKPCPQAPPGGGN